MKAGHHLTENEIQEENDWVDRARRDPRQFGKLYDRYFEGIFNFVYRRTDDEDLADDLTSQTFLKALSNIHKYEFRGLPFSAWLYRIATNEVYRHFNKRGKNPIFSIEEERVKELVSESGEADIEEKVKLVMDVMKDAPSELVEVLELRFFEEKNFKEISYILNITESGAKMRTYRALEKLKKLIQAKPGYGQE
ncbi:MAG: sigma-70 family RNA polymerase sigma factor [Cyclobacteriaceae bacterium]|nr:sigma-70 family RNA polymerase sigma factor [Cyclobacteriaceae bacterium]